MVASIAICIALLTMTKDLRPASEVFSNVTDGSNWNSKGFSFMIGFLSVAWTMTDYGKQRDLVSIGNFVKRFQMPRLIYRKRQRKRRFAVLLLSLRRSSFQE